MFTPVIFQNSSTMRKLLFFQVLVLCSFISYAQPKGELTLDLIFSGQLRQEYPGELAWMQHTDGFTKLEPSKEGTTLKFYDIKKGEWSTLVSPNELKPDGIDDPLSIEGYAWSSDETKLLIFTNTQRVWRQNTRGDYWIFDMNDKSLIQLGKNLPESSLMFAKFSPDNTKVAYVSRSNLYMEDLLSGELTQLTNDGTEDIINGTFDWAYEEEFFCLDGFRWNGDGNMIAFWQIDATDIQDFLMINNTDSLYSFTIPVQYPKVGQDPSSAKIGIVDVTSKNINWMKIPGDSKQNYLPRMQWFVKENKILVQQLNRKQNNLKIFQCDGASGDTKLVYEETDKAWIEMGSNDLTAHGEMDDLPFTNGGKSFLIMTEKDGWRHMYQIEMATGKENLLTPGDYDVAAFYQMDEKGDYLYFNASPGNATQRYLYRVATRGSSAPERVTPEEFIGISQYDISPNGKYAIHSFSNSSTPPTHTLVRLPKHKAEKVLVSNESYKNKMEEFNLPKAEFFKVKTSDGIEMDGRMIKPTNFDPGKKYPVLFEVYGEPWGQTAIDSWMSLWDYFLAQEGYLVITLDNRGTPAPKGREWRKSIYRKVGVVNSHDQAMAAKEIMKWDFVDPERIAVWGWSGGGSMTLNLLFRYPEIYQTGIAIAAVANQMYYDNIYQERYMGVPWENETDFIEGSPITYAKNLQGNLLLIHGTGDDNVHYQNAEALINELVAQSKQFDLMVYPNRSHSIYEGKGTTLHLYNLMFRYFTEHTPAGGK
jgi:dipeptidyl-peptidase 4